MNSSDIKLEPIVATEQELGASHICVAARTRSQAEPWERGARLHEQSPPARAKLQN